MFTTIRWKTELVTGIKKEKRLKNCFLFILLFNDTDH